MNKKGPKINQIQQTLGAFEPPFLACFYFMTMEVPEKYVEYNTSTEALNTNLV